MNETPSVRRSWRPHRIERHVDRVGERRAEEHSGGEQEQHARGTHDVREELRDEPGDEHDPQRENDVLDRHVGDSAQLQRTVAEHVTCAATQAS